MNDIQEQFVGLKGCDQTEVICSDGEKVILFHALPLSDDDIDLISSFTSQELNQILEYLGFSSHKMGNA